MLGCVSISDSARKPGRKKRRQHKHGRFLRCKLFGIKSGVSETSHWYCNDRLFQLLTAIPILFIRLNYTSNNVLTLFEITKICLVYDANRPNWSINFKQHHIQSKTLKQQYLVSLELSTEQAILTEITSSDTVFIIIVNHYVVLYVMVRWDDSKNNLDINVLYNKLTTKANPWCPFIERHKS